ncbi:MAG: signal peptidase I [Janthinobacterium lividum]
MTTLSPAKLTTYFRAASGRRSVAVSQWEQVVLGCLLAVATTMFVMQGFCVSGECMQPHLYTGERVLANKLAYYLSTPKRGQIVIFDYPKDIKQIYVKRVIGLPGETVAIRDGFVSINGKLLPEPYKTFTAHGDMAPQTIPSGQYFVMGDNRDVSDDSRYWGDLPRYDIIGQAVACYWPPSHCQILR